jgi:hypothetical protein
MTKNSEERTALPLSGARVLPSVQVDSYNLEIKDEEGFIGDRARKGAFWEIVDDIRKTLKDVDDDPLGDIPTEEIGKEKLAALLAKGSPEQAGVVQTAIDEFARQLAFVIRKFMRLKDWRDTECIVIGGGFSGSLIGRLAVGRAAVLLKSDGMVVDLQLIRSHPNEAGLLGAAHLLPAWMLEGYDAMLAVDIGGTNIRAGLIELNLKRSPDLAASKVAKFELWRHADEEIDRASAVSRLAGMIKKLIEWADKNGLRLAPVIGIGCPGVIEEDGSIARGAQNLPGNWESSRFNLVDSLRDETPTIGKHETVVVMHNDAVVQGLSELPRVQDRLHWAVLTIGTGLGNARYTNRRPEKPKPGKIKRAKEKAK